MVSPAAATILLIKIRLGLSGELLQFVKSRIGQAVEHRTNRKVTMSPRP